MDTKESGRLGGQRRALNLTPKQRREIASRAARARWAKIAARKDDSFARHSSADGEGATWTADSLMASGQPSVSVSDSRRKASVERLLAIAQLSLSLSSVHKALPEGRERARLRSQILLLATEYLQISSQLRR